MTVLAASVVALVAAEPASAIPSFAQRYKVECHMCHQGFPKLNRTGQRFKERGFRLENEDPFKASDWLNSIPVRARLSGSRYFFEEGDSFDFAFLKLLSAGNLGPRVSYWADTGFLFDDVDGNDTHTKPDNAWVRLEVLKGGKLYLRGGRIELDLPFTQTRTPNLFPYEIYYVNTGIETESLANYQHGAELGGQFGEDAWHWSAAITSGDESDPGEAFSDAADDFEGNVFLRLAHRGDASRFGTFAYFGRNTLIQPRTGGPAPQWEDDILRLGADADIWASKLNLYGLYMYGRNSDALVGSNGAGRGESSSFHGGFVQADYHAVEKQMEGFLKEVLVVLTLRANYARFSNGSAADDDSLSSVYPGVRLYVRERFRLAFEYGFTGQDRLNGGAVQAELVF